MNPRTVKAVYPSTVTITGGIVNTHTHPRNLKSQGDGRSECFMPYYDGVYHDVIAIGNTSPALTTRLLAREQAELWRPLTKAWVHVAGLMTEKTVPEEVAEGYDWPENERAFLCMKMFLRSVSNSGGNDVDDIRAIVPVVRAMTHTKWQYRKTPMVLKIHCERKFTPLGRRIEVSDRERIAVERDIEFLLREVPEAVIEICHVSDGATIDAIRYYQSLGYQVYGEISPHYSNRTIDDLFEDGMGGTALNVHEFCLPVFKSRKDMVIILAAMTSGEPWFHFGNDEACHNHNIVREKGVKINSAGIALGGQTQIPEAIISYVIEKFAEAGRLDHLSDFLSGNARRLYGLRKIDVKTTFNRVDWTVPREITKNFDDEVMRCVVAMGGQDRKYRLAQTGV